KLLLATDLAARGLDIPGLTYVINFDIPSETNTYMHRAGRTGRMNAEGYVVTLGDDHDFRDLKKLLADQLQIERVYFAGYHLTTEKHKFKEEKKKTKKQNMKTKTMKNKTKKPKKRDNNMVYHPHYLK